MKLLFDQNLSFKLAAALKETFPGSVHVKDIPLDLADDETVWNYAGQNGFAICTKDSDFHQLSFLRGHPPKVIWLRVGNCSTGVIEGLLRKQAGELQIFDSDESSALLYLPR